MSNRSDRFRGGVFALAIALSFVVWLPAAAAQSIEGAIYDSTSGDTLVGARVSLRFDSDDPVAPGESVDATNLVAGQQGQVTGSSGRYRFDLSGLSGRRFRIAVATDATSHVFPSAVVPPNGLIAPNGPVSSEFNPAPNPNGVGRTYYLRFAPAGPDTIVTNNHVPLDALRNEVDVSITADRHIAEVGDIITLRVDITNNSTRDLSTSNGGAAFVRIASARGFDLLPKTAVVRSAQTVFQPQTGGVSSGDRIVRFGPIDVAARGRVRLEVRAVVGVDTRPGRNETRVLLADLGGIALADPATVKVVVNQGRGVLSSVIVGRVFCDGDASGDLTSGERGVYGAKVYLDSGSFATTDSGGLFHFGRVPEGTRVLKIDRHSLGGGRVRGKSTQLLRLTPGLPGKANFPINCNSVIVTGSDPRVNLSHPKFPTVPAKAGLKVEKRLVVEGDLVLLAVKLDGAEMALPSAQLSLEVPDALKAGGSSANIKPPPVSGYGTVRPRFQLGFKPPNGVVATRWHLVISERGNRGNPFFSISGNGDPPKAIEWDGRGNAGGLAPTDKLYVAQLVVIGSRAKVEATSQLLPFGIGYGEVRSGPQTLTWSSALFGASGGAPVASAKLKVLVAELASSLRPGDSLAIGVHAAASSSRVEALALTQERADVTKKLFVEAGVSAASVVARGRGVAEPAAGGKLSRRIEITVQRGPSSNAGETVPRTISINASALIDGQPAEVSEAGRFRWEGAVPARGSVLIDVQARDGRRGSVDVSLAKGAREPNQTVRKVVIAADLNARTLRVGERPLDERLFAFDLTVRKKADGQHVATASIPKGVSVTESSVVLLSGGSATLLRLDVNGEVALPTKTPDDATVQLIAVLTSGGRAYSPTRTVGNGKPRATPQALIVNGVTWPVVSGKASGDVEVPDGGAVLVDATDSTGRRALHVVVLEGAVSETIEEQVPTVSKVAVRATVTRKQLLDSKVAGLEIELPSAGTTVASQLAVRGRIQPGTRLSIEGVAVKPDASGAFATIAELPPGLSELTIVSVDRAGYRAELKWPLKVRSSSLFAMGLGELLVSSSITERGLLADTAYLAGMAPDTTLVAGPLLIHGRATLYLKGELATKHVFERVRFTAHLDTGKERLGSAFFEDVLNPVRDTPTFGDSAIETRDTPGRGKLYVRIDADDSQAVVGALVAEVGRGDLFRYGRTIDGAGLSIKDSIGDTKVGLDAFGTTQSSDSARDHVVYRSTGGTLYYLRFANVLEGSERIRAVVRDRDTGMIASERTLRRNIDYTIDYLAGRVWLIDPLASTEASPNLLSNLESSLAPSTGNPVYLDARYEHRDPSALGDKAAGLEASVGVGGLTLSGGAAGEWRGSGNDYRLWGARAHFKAGERGALTAEVAGAKRREGDVELSVDGGLSFRELGWEQPFENPDDESGRAWKASAQVFGGDLTDKLEGVDVALYAQKIDRNFSATGSELERGRLKFGGSVATALGKRDRLTLRHTGDISELPRIGPTSADIPMADRFLLDERASFLTALAWTGVRGRLTHRASVAHQRLSATAAREDGSASIDARRFGAAGSTSVALSENVSLGLSQEVWSAARDSDPVLHPIDPSAPLLRTDEPLAGVTTGLDLAWRLLEDATFTTELRQRWNGDHSASVGLRAKLSELGSFYVAERAVRSSDGPRAVTVIGSEDRFGPNLGGRSYGEYQIENTGRGTRNRAVLGLGQRIPIGGGVGLGLGFEHQQVFGGFLPDGTPVGNQQRDLIRASLSATPSRDLRASVTIELRADRASDIDGIERELLDSDPRDPSGIGFADHGGPAPGSPLFLSTGKQTQAVGSAGLSWRPQEGVSLFGRARSARTFTGAAVGFTEVTTGLAYRSLLSDRLALLLRYSFIRERRPEAAELERETSHVFAVVPVAELSRRWRLSGKIAFKRTDVSGGLADSARVSAALGLLRLGLRLTDNWDATVEGRGLALDGDDREMKLGTLVELGYYFDEFFRFGLGYNFSHFNDQELGDLTRDAHGLFLRLTAEF